MKEQSEEHRLRTSHLLILLAPRPYSLIPNFAPTPLSLTSILSILVATSLFPNQVSPAR